MGNILKRNKEDVEYERGATGRLLERSEMGSFTGSLKVTRSREHIYVQNVSCFFQIFGLWLYWKFFSSMVATNVCLIIDGQECMLISLSTQKINGITISLSCKTSSPNWFCYSCFKIFFKLILLSSLKPDPNQNSSSPNMPIRVIVVVIAIFCCFFLSVNGCTTILQIVCTVHAVSSYCSWSM